MMTSSCPDNYCPVDRSVSLRSSYVAYGSSHPRHRTILHPFIHTIGVNTLTLTYSHVHTHTHTHTHTHLQRTYSHIMPVSRAILHLAALGYTSWGYQKFNTLVFAKYFSHQYGGMTQFLTILGLYASQICMGTSILADLTGARVLKKAKRVLLLISLPVETVVSAVYWPLVLLAPFLLVPELNEDVSSFDPTVPTFIKIPILIDLALHAAPGATLLADFFLFEKPYLPPQSTTGALYATVFLATGYASWAEWCAYQNNGIFPYPFLTIAPLPVRGAIYAGASWAALAFFRFVNGQKLKYHRGVANGKAKTG